MLKKMLSIIILLLAICEGARIPIELMIKSPIDSDKLQPTFHTKNPTHLSSIQPRYFLYNILQVDPNRAIPLVHFPYGEPSTSYVTPSFNYYGAPLYTYQIHYSPLFPNVPSMIPSYIPQQQPPTIMSTTTTERPINNNDDNIEKLDEKVDPNLEINSNNEEESMNNDDSVVIEAID